jgi:hypothetical protein
MLWCAPWLASVAQAVSLLSDELELYLPWIAFQQQTYEASLIPGVGDGLVFSLDEFGPRAPPSVAAEAALTSVDMELAVDIPLVSFRGELYSAELAHDGDGAFRVAKAEAFASPAGRGAVLSFDLLGVKTPAEILTEIGLVAVAAGDLRFDVALFRVGYRTLDAFGNLIPASGVVGAPLGISAGAPLLSVQHGTIVSRDNAPSADPAATGADLALYLMGSQGYLTLVPDYLGFGDSTGLHPFVHAKTLAWAVIDLIRAARSLAVAADYPLNDQLFLVGYSEGGYATMAAQREIETHNRDEFAITASAPMAGPYDLSGTMLELALSGTEVPNPMYFPYVLLSYNQIYGFEDDPADLLAAEYGGTIVPIFDGEHDRGSINRALPPVPLDVIEPGLAAVLLSGEYHPLVGALENNDVYRWTPVFPTRLYHCLGDDQVPYANSSVARDWFNAAGADVELVPLLFGDHSACAVPALLGAKVWFDSLAILP